MKWAIFEASCERVNGFPVHIGMPPKETPLQSTGGQTPCEHSRKLSDSTGDSSDSKKAYGSLFSSLCSHFHHGFVKEMRQGIVPSV